MLPNLSLRGMAIMGVIICLYFIGGFFMDSMAMIVVTLPIFYPVVQKLGFDPMVTTPEQFGAFIANELRKWPPLLQAAGLKAE